jgi:hypothetical protein
MLIIVPTRSRPENVAKVVDAWESTGAFDDGAHLLFAYDLDDQKAPEYRNALHHHKERSGVFGTSVAEWMPMVHKLNRAASAALMAPYFAIGFAGDDHLPRTRGWAGRYMDALAEMGTGIVSCPDGYRPDQLPTQWAMTSDIVRALGRMVPAPVEHLYCDNAVQDLGQAAGCYRYLDDVLIEHMHPLAKRGQWDVQYHNVNSKTQFSRDELAYRKWKRAGSVMLGQVQKVRDLMAAHRA